MKKFLINHFKVFLLLSTIALGEIDISFAQIIHENMPITNGAVKAVLKSGNTIYLGGTFRGLGPNVPFGSSINTTTGLPDLNYAKPNDAVNAVVPDGAGGWYIGGDFTEVGGIPRNYIARINADGSVNNWNPGADNYIRALAISGNTLYAGGDFSNIGGMSRSFLAAFDLTTGNIKSWSADTDAP
ncbi:MAG TPA: delta-60 repeat domain-containing protein, partial [Ginsengibacter sp.]|nr:delta-60 repeat domain-containing protein [Ginsengibacter sp.]